MCLAAKPTREWAESMSYSAAIVEAGTERSATADSKPNLRVMAFSLAVGARPRGLGRVCRVDERRVRAFRVRAAEGAGGARVLQAPSRVLELRFPRAPTRTSRR